MSESKDAPSKGGWIKAAVAAVASALSGALLMYASPLLDMVIKPAKPLANFECQANGLKVTVQNKSTGGHEGVWDFGDGSALEPFVPEHTTINHTYAKSGSYGVKLSLKNIINEENERSVTLVVGEDTTSDPTVELRVAAVHGNYSPALFRAETTVKNATMCVWIVGNRRIEFNPDTANNEQVRLFTIKEPGTHVIKVAAFNGKKTVEHAVNVVVQAPPAGSMTATLDVTYEAVFVEQKPASPVVQLTFPMNQKGDVIAVTKTILPEIGFEIVKAAVQPPPIKNAHIKSTKVQLDPAKPGQALLTCELVRPSAHSAPPVCTVQVAVIQQRQSAPTTRAMDPVAVLLSVPGSTPVPLPELPAGWVAKSRKMTLTLQQDAKQFTYKDVMPHNLAVQLSPATHFIVNTVEQAGTLRIDLQPLKSQSSLIGR